MTTITSDFVEAGWSRSDDHDAEPVPFRSGRTAMVPSSKLNVTQPPSEVAFTIGSARPRRRVVARAFAEKVVEEYVTSALHHVRTRQFPDGNWIADVVGLGGAWSDGTSEADAVAALPDVLFDWLMLKIEDGDDDIPPLDGLNLNGLRVS